MMPIEAEIEEILIIFRWESMRTYCFLFAYLRLEGHRLMRGLVVPFLFSLSFCAVEEGVQVI